MGISPIAIAEIFSCSPESRRAMENSIYKNLTTESYIGAPSNLTDPVDRPLGQFLFTCGRGVRLRAWFTVLSDDQCSSQLSVFHESMSNPNKSEIDCANKLFSDLVKNGFCSSVILRNGGVRKGLFGKKNCSIILASPDFAKLSVLRMFNKLNISAVSKIARDLSTGDGVVSYDEDEWKVVRKASLRDARFAPAIL